MDTVLSATTELGELIEDTEFELEENVVEIRNCRVYGTLSKTENGRRYKLLLKNKRTDRKVLCKSISRTAAISRQKLRFFVEDCLEVASEKTLPMVGSAGWKSSRTKVRDEPSPTKVEHRKDEWLRAFEDLARYVDKEFFESALYGKDPKERVEIAVSDRLKRVTLSHKIKNTEIIHRIAISRGLCEKYDADLGDRRTGVVAMFLERLCELYAKKLFGKFSPNSDFSELVRDKGPVPWNGMKFEIQRLVCGYVPDTISFPPAKKKTRSPLVFDRVDLSIRR